MPGAGRVGMVVPLGFGGQRHKMDVTMPHAAQRIRSSGGGLQKAK